MSKSFKFVLGAALLSVVAACSSPPPPEPMVVPEPIMAEPTYSKY